jgi:WD40 repeat protein
MNKTSCRFFLVLVLAVLIFSLFAHAQKPELVVPVGHTAPINSAVWSPDEKLIATGGDDRMIKLWDAENGRLLRTIVGTTNTSVHALAFSPDGRFLAGSDFGARVVEAHNAIRFWNVTNGSQVSSVETGDASGIAFSPNGHTLAAAGGYEGEVLLWSITGPTTGPARILGGHISIGRSIAFSPDGSLLASGDLKNVVLIREVTTGRVLRKLDAGDGVQAVAFSLDGRWLAVGGGAGVLLFDREDDWTMLRLTPAHSGNVTALAFSADGKHLASGGQDSFIKLWEIGTNAAPVARKTFHIGAFYVSSLSFSRDGRTLLSNGGEKFTYRLWDVEAGREVPQPARGFSRVNAASFSPDGRKLVHDAGMGKAKLWDLAAGREPRTLAFSGPIWRYLSFDTEGNKLFANLEDVESGNLETRDATTGRKLNGLSAGIISRDGNLAVVLDHEKKFNLIDTYTHGIKFQLGVRIMPDAGAFSPDGSMVAIGGSKLSEDCGGCPMYGRAELWDTASGKLRYAFDASDSVRSLSFSPDGRTLAGGIFTKELKLWDTRTGRETLSLLAHDRVESVAFSPDGNVLATGGQDGQIKLWNPRTGALIHTLDGQKNVVGSVDFSPDGKLLLSAGWDGTTRLWDPSTGRELASLFTFGEKDWLVVTPDGLFDGTPTAWSQLFWRYDGNTFNIAPIEIFFNEFYYPDLLADIYAGRRPIAVRDLSNVDRRQPQVKLTSPDPGTVAARTIRVQIEVAEAPADVRWPRGSGVRDVRLFRNGSLVKAWRGDVLQNRSNITIDAMVPVVSGENRFTAYAFNRDNVKSPDAQLTLTGPGSLKRAGVAYVFAIGLNEYANHQYDLKYAVADASLFAREVRVEQERLGRYGRVEVVSLLDRQATKASILASLDALAARVQPEDALFVYFAGHGTAHENSFYLLPHDLGYGGARANLDAKGLRSILDHGVSDRELEQAFERIDAGQIVLVIDACNSGQALEAEEKRRGPMNSKGLAQLAYEKGMYVLTAAQSFQAAQEASQLGHGLLTFALVEEGLKQAAADAEPKDGIVLLREWLDYATARVPDLQLDRMNTARIIGRDLSFAESERGLALPLRSGQRPRAFYRREIEASPFVIARTNP